MHDENNKNCPYQPHECWGGLDDCTKIHCTCPAPIEEWDVEHDIIRIGNLIGCDLCKKGDEIRNDPVCVPKMKAFRLSARTEVLKSLLEKIEAIETTLAVSHSDSYQIGQNHGRQEMKRSVTDIIKGMMNEK